MMKDKIKYYYYVMKDVQSWCPINGATHKNVSNTQVDEGFFSTLQELNSYIEDNYPNGEYHQTVEIPYYTTNQLENDGDNDMLIDYTISVEKHIINTIYIKETLNDNRVEFEQKMEDLTKLYYKTFKGESLVKYAHPFDFCRNCAINDKECTQ